MQTPDFIEILEKASKKQLTQMTGDKEVASWISEKLKRDDVALWFARAYKNDPKILNDANKRQLEHYGSMLNEHKELKDLRLDKGHDFKEGLNKLSEANKAAEKRQANNPQLIEPDEGTKKLMDTRDGYAWYELDRPSCKREGGAMGHCGNTASAHKDDTIFSLRQEIKQGDKVYHKPAATFINNQGHLGEMKGRANQKPSDKYHEDIKQLLMSDHVDNIMGGGYASHNNFSLSDMPEDMQKEILDAKPGLNRMSKFEKVNLRDFPDKHDKEAEQHNRDIDTINKAFEKHGDLSTVVNNMGTGQIDSISRFKEFRDRLSSDDIHNIIGNYNEDLLADHHGFEPEDMDHEDHYNNKQRFFQQLLDSKNANGDHADVISDMKDQSMGPYSNEPEHAAIDAVLSSRHFTKEKFEEYFNNDKNRDMQSAVVNTKYFKPEHMEQAISHKNNNVVRNAIASDHFKEEHADSVVDHKDQWVLTRLASSTVLNSDHIDKLVDRKVKGHGESSIHHALSQNPNTNKDQYDRMFYNGTASINSPHYGVEHIEHSIKGGDSLHAARAMRHKDFTEDHLTQVIGNHGKSSYIAQEARRHPKFNDSHHEMLKDMWSVKKGIDMEEIETLEKGGCVRCGKPSKNGGKGGRCSACLKKLAANKKKPGHWQRAQTKADDALRRQDGKNGTASKKSSGRGKRSEIVKQHQSAEKRTGQKLSPDRKDNSKGYSSKNVRSIPEKLNRGRHKADSKKLAAWRKGLKKHDMDFEDLNTLIRAKLIETGNDKLAKSLELVDLERLLGEITEGVE